MVDGFKFNKYKNQTSNKLILLISQMFHINPDFIDPETSWSEIGITELEKERLMNKLQESFKVTIPNQKRMEIKTVWNALQFIESHDGWNGKPAAYNLN